MTQVHGYSPSSTMPTDDDPRPLASAAAAAAPGPVPGVAAPADRPPVDGAAERTADNEEDLRRIHLHMPVDVRSLSLAVLAVLASVFALHWAREVLVPLLLGVMVSYALTPLVDRLEAWRVPRFVASTLVMGALVGALGALTWALADDAEDLIETLPTVAQRIRELTADAVGTEPGAIDRVQAAAAELERATTAAAATAAASAAVSAASASAAVAALPSSTAISGPPRLGPGPSVPAKISPGVPARTVTTTVATTTTAPTRVVVEKARFDVRDYLWSGALGVAFFLGQLTIVVFIAFFLLAAGRTFRRKMVKIAGSSLSQKRITLQALDEIGDHIQLYLLVQVATSVLVGVLTGLAFWAMGLNNAAVWGVIAGVTNMIPYVGSVLVGGASAVVAWLQFGALNMGLAVGGASFLIHTIVGNVVTPLLTGRANRMNPFAVFVAVLAFGWLWGIWGLLLGVPILVVVKTVCERVEELHPVAELLGD
jgi:predicted PurR-regulated permease PerM